MSKFVDCAQDQAFLLLPDLRNWIPEDDLAHFNREFGLVSIKAETAINNRYVWNSNSGAKFFTCSAYPKGIGQIHRRQGADEFHPHPSGQQPTS